ncbi:MAG: aldehyde dehydrogenase family protein [Spongiibacter sp.]|nr:aldehyde dehydrogenase family protein [Spongiibacter sp.]
MISTIQQNVTTGELDMDTAVGQSITDIFHTQRAAHQALPMPDRNWRLARIARCVDFVVEQQEAIVEATIADWQHKPASFVKAMELLPVLNHAKHIRKHLAGWMKDAPRAADFPFNLMGAKAFVRYQPLGVVGVMVPWNGPVAMAMVAAMDAFSAGNRCMVKISEFSPHVAAMLEQQIPQYFDSSELAIVTGELEVSQQFAALPFDHLMYTGSSDTARHIMAAAAKNLTPVTLELGGKSPVIVDSDCDIDYAAQRTMSGRLINTGQGCITPDYVLIEAARLEDFLAAAEAATREMYPLSLGGRDYAAIATDAHYQRMLSLRQEALDSGCRCIEIDVGGESAKRQVNPLIVVNPPADSRLATEEIFGPILVVFTCDGLQGAIDHINRGEKPLALYYFGNESDKQQQVLDQTSAGGVAINEVMMQLMMSQLPFGGVGHSGMGSYWGGRAGFDRFSHAKSVFRQGWYKKLGAMMDPPYGSTMENMLKMQLKKPK